MPDSSRDALLKENAALREINARQQEQIEALTRRIDQITQDNTVLRLKIDAMARKLFGRSSEKLDPDQLQMVFDALADPQAAKKPDASDCAPDASEAEEPAPPAATGKRKKRTLNELIDGLPVTEVLIDPDEVKDDPAAWTCIGAETTRLIDYTPGHFHCQKLVRRKYVRKDERHLPPITAPLRTLQDRCIATPRLLAHTLAQRFEQHLPFYRIEASYARQGTPIPRQTLCAWSGMTHDACQLLLEHIRAEVFADGYVQIDETPVRYQDPKRQGVCGTGYLWVAYNPVRNLSYFQWHTGRSAECLKALVPEGYTGLIQSDGYSAYRAFIKQQPDPQAIHLAGCMAHVRRKFFDARAEGEDPQWVLAQIQRLYRIEANLRHARAGPTERRRIRQQDGAPILECIKSRLEQLQASHKHRPRSLAGEAIRYALNQWDRLLVFLRDGRVEIDNNLVENTIRPSAIGKKNWLFMGDPTSGARAATFYTLIDACHREQIDVTAYLTDLFTRLPSETNQTVHRLTPKAWAEARREAKAAKLVTTP
tara:strand:- start:165 stop:1778 length:1614 start_codon:yes stop_codon:yes gene_type:complete